MKILSYQNFRGVFASLCIGVLFLFANSTAAQTVTPINRIQGETNTSSFDKKQVTTRGIVTAIVRRGFFIQTPDAETDKNPKTSEGIYVFTNNQMPPEVVVGNLLEVEGTVTEFRQPNDRFSLTITEITRPSVKIISQNNALPAPIVLTGAELDPRGGIDQMERFEGMRVRVESLSVVAPTGGSTDEKTGEARSNGVLFAVIAGTPRPFREAGLDALTQVADKLPPTTPVFDMNPELLRIDSNSLVNSKPIDVTSGASLKNVTGIIDYAYKAYTLLVDPANPPTVEGNKTFVPASAASEREVTVGSFNIENFFDDEKNSENVQDESIVSKEVFQKRLTKASLAIRNVLSMPDVLGVVEVENLAVLKKLADKINADAVASNQPNPKYEAYLQEGNDIRGIDVGFLVKSSKVKVVKTEQLAKDVKFEGSTYPDEKLFDRPPFLISVEVPDAKTNKPLAFTVIVNHLKSYRGIDDEKDGDRVRQKRRLEAEWLANFVVERQKANPTERLIICGDFNAFQHNDGYNDLIGILKGKPDPNVVAPSKNVYSTGLRDLVDYAKPAEKYSYTFNGSAQVLDHILVNQAASFRVIKFGYARVDADFPEIYSNDISRPERLSDHDAPVLYLSLDEIKPKEPVNP